MKRALLGIALCTLSCAAVTNEITLLIHNLTINVFVVDSKSEHYYNVDEDDGCCDEEIKEEQDSDEKGK